MKRTLIPSLLLSIPLATASLAQDIIKKQTPAERDQTTKLQIFLDQQLFGPGKIDGLPGEFTTKALIRYQRARGLDATGKPEDGIDLNSVGPVYIDYTIQAGDLSFVGPSPSEPADQAKLQYLPYRDLLEFLTERFHCSPDFLLRINKESNPELNLERLKEGDVVRVPNVEPFKVEEVPKTGGFLPEIPEFKKRTINVNRAEKLLELTEGDKLLACVPITPGAGNLETPAGTWKIMGIATAPTFRWDKSVLETGVRSDRFYMLPPGPNNPVGVLWCGLNKPGIGIHGTNSPQTIGRTSSHGCMRVANWDVVRLSKLITKGMTVVIE